jgi:hypothetical protein
MNIFSHCRWEGEALQLNVELNAEGACQLALALFASRDAQVALSFKVLTDQIFVTISD